MAKPPSTLLFFLLLLILILSGPSRPHTPRQASPANHLPQSLFLLRSSGAALLGTLGAASLLPIRPASPPGMAPPGMAPPGPPSSAPGWGAAPCSAPAVPALLPPLEASQADSLQLGRAGEEESSPIRAPKPSEQRWRHRTYVTVPGHSLRREESESHGITELFRLEKPSKITIPTASPALSEPPLNHVLKFHRHMVFRDFTTALG